MRQSRLRERTADRDLSRPWCLHLLQSPCESEWVDYKEILPLDDERSRACFTRDVIAIRNSGGGYLVVGVEDKTWKCRGLPEPFPMDSKQLRDVVRSVSGLDLAVTIAQHRLLFENEWNYFALIHVAGPSNPNKLRNPSVPKKSFCSQEKWGLVKGAAYYRDGDSTVVVKDRDVTAFADALIEKLSQDVIEQEVAPFVIDDGFYKLLDTGYESFVGRTGLRGELEKAVNRDPRIWIINVHGPGGVGKSALVNWFTHRCYEDRTYDAILQLTAKASRLTPEGIARITPTLYSLEGLLDNILVCFGESADKLSRKRDLAYEALASFRFLLVLDNMETVEDARILDFIQNIPGSADTKVLLTSRRRSGSWELPLYVQELESDEISEFVEVKSTEMGFSINATQPTVKSIREATGGLPLAIVWLLGRYKVEPDLEAIVKQLKSPDSPVLEFSFRNIWITLSRDARDLLGAFTVFDETPTLEMLGVTTDWPLDRIDAAMGQLEDVTLVKRILQKPTGSVVYSALPLTLDFAARESSKEGSFAAECSKRYQGFLANIEDTERGDLGYIFDRFGISGESEKKAARLCKQAESQAFSGNIEIAENLYQQALDFAPKSPYVLCQASLFERQQGNLRAAETHVDEACRQAETKRVRGFCFSVRAMVMEAKGARGEVLSSLEMSLENDPENVIARHRYGVALSKDGQTDKAIDQFSEIIRSESKRKYPGQTLVMALTTRALNLDRLGQRESAREDIAWARRLLEKNPYLQSTARQLEHVAAQIGADNPSS